MKILGSKASPRDGFVFFLSALCSLCLCGSNLHAANAEVKKPYLLRVILHVADHPLLTPVFRDRVARELEASLQGSLGELARVQVVGEHPRLQVVLDRGLKTLDGWNERSEFKDHFVLISYSGVHYEIEARQHDGLTGLASPIVRKDRTRDRDFVARTAALLVDRDFGPVGAFASWPSGDSPTVRLELKGGGLGVPLGRWVKKGDVFAIAQTPGGAGPGPPVESALLVVQEPPKDKGDGGCTGRLFHRFRAPTDAAGGFQCLKLAAVRGPVRLRFMEAGPDRTLRPLSEPLSLEIRRHSFDGEKTTLLTGSPDNVGAFDGSKLGEKGLFENVAFVTVLRGGNNPVARVPVALVDDRPVLVPVAAPGSSDAGSYLASRKQLWERNVAINCSAQVSLFKQINELTAKPEGRAEALKKAEDAKNRFQDEYDNLVAERDALREEAKGLKGADRLDLTQGEQGLKQFKEGGEQLGKFFANLQKIDKEENAPERKEWQSQLERARLLIENEAEYDKAIAIYEKVKATGYNDPKFLERLDELKKLWNTSDADLRVARHFIFNVWPTLDTPGLKGRMEEARKAFETCKAKKDLLGPQRLFKATLNHNNRLTQEFAKLKPKINLDDEEEAKLIQEVNAALGKLAAELKEYLDRSAGN